MSGASAKVAEPADNVVLLDARGAVIGETPRAAVQTAATPRANWPSRCTCSTTPAIC
jgi:hypothetical protein